MDAVVGDVTAVGDDQKLDRAFHLTGQSLCILPANEAVELAKLGPYWITGLDIS